jgi:hypothetical protein
MVAFRGLANSLSLIGSLKCERGDKARKQSPTRIIDYTVLDDGTVVVNPSNKFPLLLEQLLEHLSFIMAALDTG